MGIWLTSLIMLVACSNSDTKSEGCATSLDCPRAKICDGASCISVSCTNHAECAKPHSGTFCWIGYDSSAPDAGVCSAIECKVGSEDLKCPAGFNCLKFLCFEGQPDCTANTDCKQPAEKCYNNNCVLTNYCELDADCPSEDCNLEEHTCIAPPQPDIIEDLEEVDIVLDCEPSDFDGPTSFLCAPCSSNGECGCGQGICTDIGGTDGCSIPCGEIEEETVFCPSGYTCQNDLCKPLGGSCKGCMEPPGCEAKNEVCNFKDGECILKINWCGPCTFDFECGFGSRCNLSADGAFTFCAPECDTENFSCPLASGCEIREDGLLICLYNNADCCYGVSCEQECFCEAPTPICTDENECVQCLYNGHCPPGKPICDPESHTCIIQCVAPTPIFWVDPDSGAEYCVECAKSLDCAPGMLCGTFKNDPETYHKCYAAQ